jgi:hypothetical protein
MMWIIIKKQWRQSSMQKLPKHRNNTKAYDKSPYKNLIYHNKNLIYSTDKTPSDQTAAQLDLT